MTESWLDILTTNPLPALLDWKENALAYFIRRDLLLEPVPSIESLWELPEAEQLVKKQRTDGSWKYPGKPDPPDPRENYSLLETYRNLRVLMEMYGFTRAHSTLQYAAEYVFSCQTKAGDIRGILGNQYMPYYHGAILELLIKAGYENDPRAIAGLDWLLAMRQEDGGWIVPAQAVRPKERTPQFWIGEPIPPDRAKPHAHLATGMVLRAFAAHPVYRQKHEIIAAGKVLKERILQPDKYNDRRAITYWLKFQFPFWWANLLTVLDSLSRLGFEKEDVDIARGLNWFITHQENDGLWPTGYGSGKKSEANRRWVGLAICRVLKSFYSSA
jgi:hypothetical protein